MNRTWWIIAIVALVLVIPACLCAVLLGGITTGGGVIYLLQPKTADVAYVPSSPAVNPAGATAGVQKYGEEYQQQLKDLAGANTDIGDPVVVVPTASCISIAEFQAMWEGSTPDQGPGPLIQALNVAWDVNGVSDGVSRIGEGWEVGSHTVQPMALVWTDLLHNDPPAPGDKWVPLRTQGQWGVFAVYDTVIVPTPGRYGLMCESLNPEQHLSGW